MNRPERNTAYPKLSSKMGKFANKALYTDLIQHINVYPYFHKGRGTNVTFGDGHSIWVQSREYYNMIPPTAETKGYNYKMVDMFNHFDGL